jgi:uncharacterized protein (TIGR00251 family)
MRFMQLQSRSNGFALAVKVVPGASRNAIAGTYGDGIKVTVSAAPERGAANDAVIRLLAEVLGVPTSGVQIVRGQTSPRKEVLIIGLTAEEIEQRLGG